MKEWQRTPLQLVREYCQKQKRPMPQLLNASAPAGRFAFVFSCIYTNKIGFVSFSLTPKTKTVI